MNEIEADCRRHDRGDPRRERQTRRVRAANLQGAPEVESGVQGAVFKKSPHRESRRDRPARHPRVSRARHPTVAIHSDVRRRRAARALRRRGGVHRPCRRRRRATSTSRPSSRPPRSRAPTRSTRATGSCRRTPSSREAVRASAARLHRSDARRNAHDGRQGPRALTMEKAGVPVLPGTACSRRRGAMSRRQPSASGYPVILKASAGGGGRGMKIVCEPESSRDFETATREAIAAFNNATCTSSATFRAAPHRDPDPRRQARRRAATSASASARSSVGTRRSSKRRRGRPARATARRCARSRSAVREAIGYTRSGPSSS